MKKAFIVAALLLGIATPALAQVFVAPNPSYPYYPQPTAYCPQLSYNLYVGVSDYYTAGQVTQLQQYIAGLGYYQPVTGYFGNLTRANVAQLQQNLQVYPVTGGVGPLTRAAIARSCGGTVYPPPTPAGVSITNVSGPNTITVGQGGTWQVTTNAPAGSYISVSVRWGDENQFPYPMAGAQSVYTSQYNSFTHSYQNAGTYTITFTATDQFGRSNTATQSVVVTGSTANATFSASPQSGPAPLATTFSVNTAEDQNRLYIEFGDGQTGKPNQIYCFAAPCNPAMTAQHTYTTAGTYTARLMRDNNYCPSGMYCTLMYREPTVLGTLTLTVH